ncbi:unnamed protein product [Lasius platythorax]|uniref:Uncharacterized protein n=1 Tax=Lasius platythorax TaxID=488582 RepID=A0AAV2NBE5_9HYME
MGSAFRRLKDLEKTCAAYYRPVTTTVVAQTLPSHSRTYSETTVKDIEVDDDETSTPKPREIRTGKRRKRTLPGADAKEAKKRKERGATPLRKKHSLPRQKGDSKWKRKR